MRSYNGQKNFTGLLWCVTNARHVGYESWVERDRLISLDRDPGVVGIATTHFRLDFELDGTPCSHVPDYFVKATDGSCTVIDVRPDERIDEHDQKVFSSTGRICLTVGWDYQRVGTLPRILAANLHWLAGYKHPRCFNPADAGKIRELLHEGPLDLRSLVRGAGSPVTVLPTLFHLIWAAKLVADLQSRPLGHSSLLALDVTP